MIEYSVGSDEVWLDLSALGTTVPYNTTIGMNNGNVLQGRAAFSGQNASYPLEDKVTIDLGKALAGQAFRLRFRIGTDAAAGTAGWDIDDVALTGIIDKPFPTRVADNGHCGPDAPDDEDPIRSGGGGCCDSRGRSNGLLPLSVLALMLRRRRRR